ncbi:TPA: hypothetical protein ACJIZD_004376, partial [Salmonella enterica subsp. enterica serovar Cerro]
YRFYLSFSDSINLITSEYKNLLFDLCGSCGCGIVLFLNVPVFLMAKINSPSVIPNISANVFASIVTDFI